MQANKLLASLEDLNHQQRWQQMRQLGKEAKTNPQLNQQLHLLADSKIHYERLLALMSIHGSQDKQLILKLLGDPSSFYGWSIAKLAARFLDDDALISIYPSLSNERGLYVLRALSKEGRTLLIDNFFHTQKADAKKSLHLTSEKLVNDYLITFGITQLDSNDIAKLARSYPQPIYTVLHNELTQHNQVSWRIKYACEAAIDEMDKSSPSLGLALLSQLAKLTHITSKYYIKYLPLFPKEIIELILIQPNLVRFSLSAKFLRKLSCDTLVNLVKTNALTNLKQHFSRLNIEQRVAIYKACNDFLRDKFGMIPLDYLKELPQTIREQEALHTFELPLLAAKPLVRIPYLSVLPFSKALTPLDAYLAQPDGELRASAVASLVSTGRYYPEHSTEILTFCLKRQNEQDPVRLSMMSALASLPPTRWQTEHLPMIAQIIKHALSARDCSYQTMSYASHLLLNMMAQHITFVIEQLPILLERMGSMSYYNIESRITHQQMQQLVPHLLPLLNTWLARDRSYFVVSLIHCFGIRAKGITAFADLLIQLTADKRGEVAKRGFETLLHLEFHSEINQLVPKLLKSDPSWIRVEVLANYLHRHQQQLLTLHLTLQPYKGRFNTDKTNIIPYFYCEFNRWTALQQNTYAKSLMVIIDTPKRNAWELYRAAEQLTAMPSIAVDPLVKLARENNPDLALRDKVVGLLGRIDAGRGIPALLDALDDSRARVAIYALRRSLLRMPKEQALALLANVPMTKVTVAKETLRLMGEFICEQSYQLLNQYAAQKLHPDVKIALLRAYWNYLDHEEVWHKMHQAAQDNAAIARSTIRIPQERLSAQARQLLLQHILYLLQHPEPLVRQETIERLVTMPINDAQGILRPSLINLLDDINKHTVQLAAQALLSCYAYQEDQALVNTFAKIDNAQSLQAIVNAYHIQHKLIRHDFVLWSAKQLANQLVAKGWQITQAVRLIITLDTPHDGLLFLQQLISKALLHPGIIEVCRSSYNAITHNNQQSLEAVELKLRQQKDASLRRIGLELVLILAHHFGWQENYREALVVYTQDQSPWCSETAQLIEPPPRPTLLTA